MTSRTIRAVVVNWNGGERTLAALRSLLASDVPTGHDLEVVLVDNGSTDGITQRVERELPEVELLRNDRNLGFAGAVNRALKDLDRIELVALLNNDATVAADWFAPLVATLEADDDVGAACPKILLTEQYLDLEIVAPTHVSGLLDRRPLGVRVSAVRIGDRDAWTRTRFVEGFHGPERGPAPESSYQWTADRALLRLPVDADGPSPSCELRLAADGPVRVTVRSGGETKHHEVEVEPAWYPAPLDGVPFDVINNVGTTLVRDTYGADRGWLDVDNGHLDAPADVFAWCGGAVLLRADYLRDVGLLDERLFLYSEDLELSWRGRARGWRYRTAPTSVVRHEHAATSGEDSGAKAYFDERNHLLVVTRHGDARLVARTVARYLLVTASYARRDLVAPLVARRAPRGQGLGTRLRALGGYIRLAPGMLAARRSRRPR